MDGSQGVPFSSTCGSFNLLCRINRILTRSASKMRCIAFFGVVLFCVQNVVVINAQCKDGYYNKSESCVPCPSNCAKCESDTKCTKCINGFYGDQCKTPCPHNCSGGECQLQYGYCTYGCQDGQFPLENHTGCFSCPQNCHMCSSMSTCFTCRDGFYGQNCSAMCPSECADRACNQSGTCLQCKEGYYRQADICLSCPRGCITCDNSTHCSSCHETHVGPFQARCIQRCSKNLTNFVSYFDQRCGISMDKISQNQSICFAINLEQSYKCITFRPCITCPTKDCNRTKIERHTCLDYERCSTECNPASNSHILKDVNGTTRQTLCEQTCSIYLAIDGKNEQVCPSITEGPITSSEDIDCFQEPKTAVNSEDQLTPITVVVVAGCVVVILLVGKVVCQHGKRLGRTIRRFWSPEVALAEEPIQSYRGLTSQVQVTTTRNQAQTAIPPHKDELQDDTYDKINCSKFVADIRGYNKNSVPLQRREIQADTYDKASCSTFVADNRAYNKTSVPLQSFEIPADTYDKTNCSTVVSDNRAYNNNSVPLHRLGLPADTYDTANCSTVVADNRAYNNNSVTLKRRGIPTDMSDTANCYNVVMEDGLDSTLACPSQKSCVADDDEYDFVYFDQSAPVDDIHPEVRNSRPDSADANGYSMCKMVNPDVVELL